MRSAIALFGVVMLATTRSVHAFQETPPAEKPSSMSIPPAGGLEWTVGDYKVKLGGYVKLDLIHDFNEIGSTDSFDPRTIPVVNDPTLPDEGTRMHARQSRINLDLTGPVRVFVEGDFFSSENGFRMRHAFGELAVGEDGKLLAGQTWTTFMDENAMPETLDFESPIAFPQIRTPQARFTKDLGKGRYIAFSIEDPESDVVVPGGVNGSVTELTPDLNAALNMPFERGHVRLGLWGGVVEFDTPTTTQEEAELWGMNVATKIDTFGKDNAIGQLTYGNGVGRYRGGDVAALDSTGDLEAIEVLALMLAYQHFWTDEFRSTIMYSWATGDLPSGVPATTTARVDYFALNLIWQFNPRAWTGIEYLYGSRDTANHDQGAANRLQMSIRFDI